MNVVKIVLGAIQRFFSDWWEAMTRRMDDE